MVVVVDWLERFSAIVLGLFDFDFDFDFEVLFFKRETESYALKLGILFF